MPAEDSDIHDLMELYENGFIEDSDVSSLAENQVMKKRVTQVIKCEIFHFCLMLH